MPIVEVSGLNKTFGSGDLAVHALRDINFTVDAGEPARNVPRSVVDDGHRVIEMTPLDSALRIIVEKRK